MQLINNFSWPFPFALQMQVRAKANCQMKKEISKRSNRRRKKKLQETHRTGEGNQSNRHLRYLSVHPSEYVYSDFKSDRKCLQ